MQQNIKKALSLTDYLIKAHIKNATGMEEMVKEWTTDSKGLGLEIASVHREVAECLQEIKNCLNEKPKKRRNIGYSKKQ